jgi:hypothetical protein
MTRRLTALVNVNMDPEEVADLLGVDVADLVQYGNGWAVVSQNLAAFPLILADPVDEEE